MSPFTRTRPNTSVRVLRVLVLAVLASAPLALSVGGCSAIVGLPPGAVLCQPGATPEEDPCPDDQRCIDGECRRYDCEMRPEICNDTDDDCDMRVDEMLEVDADEDSYLACNARNMELQDCDDTNPMVFPHQAGMDWRGDVPAGYEPCNGRNDDCNDDTTEADGCASGEVCYRPPAEAALACYPIADCRTTGGSICGPGTFCAPDGRCTIEMMGMECTPLTRDPRCQADSYCNAAGECVPTRPLGEGCTSAIECASGLCFESRLFGLTASVSFCGQSCCTDADCGSGFRCFVPGTGARSCLPEGMVSAVAACGHDDDCPGQRCRALGDGARVRSQCSPSSGGGLGSLCWSNSDCGSGICDPLCSIVCRRTADCDGGGGTLGCGYSDGAPTVPHCLLRDGPGTSGDSCSSGCVDGRCWNDQCADACCTDEHCPVGYRCAVIDYGGPEMRCIPLSVGGAPG